MRNEGFKKLGRKIGEKKKADEEGGNIGRYTKDIQIKRKTRQVDGGRNHVSKSNEG